MIYNILKNNVDKYTLDFMEIDCNNHEILLNLKYDFYIINWHHMSFPMPQYIINSLKGPKISVVVEVSPGIPLPKTPDWFDAYIVIDPTQIKQGKIYPFPRPLEVSKKLIPLLSTSKIVIGGFGLINPPPDKNSRFKKFVEVVENANKIGNCIVRFNFPIGEFSGTNQQRLEEYGKQLKWLAKPGIDVTVTYDYMTKLELIHWCSQNTINAFPYYRNELTGLSAVTDQAITAGRPIAITNCTTFRHMHKYISYYPMQTYLELIKSTPPGIKQMQIDWSPENFSKKFNELLIEKGIIC